jgi:hypothetical protein
LPSSKGFWQIIEMHFLQQSFIEPSLVCIDEGLLSKGSSSGQGIEMCCVLLRGHLSLFQVLELRTSCEFSVWLSKGTFEGKQKLLEGLIWVGGLRVEERGGETLCPGSGHSVLHPGEHVQNFVQLCWVDSGLECDVESDRVQEAFCFLPVSREWLGVSPLGLASGLGGCGWRVLLEGLLDCSRYETSNMCSLVSHVIQLFMECGILLLELGEEVVELVSGNGYWSTVSHFRVRSRSEISNAKECRWWACKGALVFCQGHAGDESTKQI